MIPLKSVNEQPISPKILCHIDDINPMLKVNSVWNTFQGEGPLAGYPATFIRLSGCNLRCNACDTEYTEGEDVSTSSLISHKLLKYKHEGWLVVLTGGEPFRQPIGPLVNHLLSFGFPVQIETNGTLFDPTIVTEATMNAIKNGQLQIVCSPKTGYINPDLREFITALKYVVDHRSVDFSQYDAGVVQHTMGMNKDVAPPFFRVGKKVPVYVQPLDTGIPEENEKNLEVAKTLAFKRNWILSIQIHKMIGVQ